MHDFAYYFNEWEQKKDPALLHKFIMPKEAALDLVPKITVRDTAVDALCHGANLTAPGVLTVESGIEKQTLVAILTLKGEAVAIASAQLKTEEILHTNRGTVATLDRVLMDR